MKSVGEHAQNATEGMNSASEAWLEYCEDVPSGDLYLKSVTVHLRMAQVEATLAVAAALVNLTRAQAGPL